MELCGEVVRYWLSFISNAVCLPTDQSSKAQFLKAIANQQDEIAELSDETKKLQGELVVYNLPERALSHFVLRSILF